MERTGTPFPIPKRTSLPRDTRRRSLPAPSRQGARQPKAPRDRTNREPASPEVIASLISSLSAVSLPASEHFDDKTLFTRASQSTPASPNAFRTSFTGRGDYFRRSSGVPPIPRSPHLDSDGEAFHDSVEYLHPNDAAAPPVIRTSKRNSGTYPFSDATPNSGEVTPFWKRYARENGGEYPEQDAQNSAAAAPTVDIVDRRRSSATSVARRHQKGLTQKGSRETIREREGKRGLGSIGDQSGTLQHGRTDRGDGRREKRASASTSPPVVGPTFDENFFTFNVPDFSATSKANSRDATVGPSEVAQDADPTLVPDGFIPARRASLRRASGPRATDANAEQSSAPKSSRALDASDQSRREVDRTVSDLLNQTRDIGTSNGAETSNGARSKRRKGPPESMVFSRSTKLRSPVGSPTIVPSRPTTKEDSKENRPATAGGETRATGDDESAPSPAVMQRRARDGPTNTKSYAATYLKARSVSPAGRPSQESSPQAARSNAAQARRRSSRLRRRSQPADGKGAQRHQRTFSNPLGRNSTSSAVTRPPQIVVEDRPSTADSIEDAVDAYLCSPRLSQKIHHPETGRVISFSEVGDSEGFAVFCCVGMGLTRYIMAFYDELALTLKLRLITPDRPGVGESDAHTDGAGTPLGWPGQYSSLLSHYHIPNPPSNHTDINDI